MSVSTRMHSFATHMRNNPTPHEAMLWRELRGSKLGGFYFQRQVPIRCYVVDFYCRAAQLAVEVDGGGHSTLAARDLCRDNTLAKAGVTVLRFSNASVEKKILQVLEKISATCAQRISLTNSQAHQRTTIDINPLRKTEEEEEQLLIEENIDNLERINRLSILQCEKLLDFKHRPPVRPSCRKEVYAGMESAENMVRWLTRLGIEARPEKCGDCGLIHVLESR